MKQGAFNQRRRKQKIFYYSMIILPVLQFCVFYIYANFNMILLAFQKYTNKVGALGYDVTFAGFENFKTAITYLSKRTFMISNSFKVFLLCTLVAMTLAIFFSFYIYKKYPMHGLFRIILFLPQIISNVVFVLLFKYIATDVYVYVVEKLTGETVMGLLDNLETRMNTVYIYSVFMGFGVNVLLFGGAMSGINDSVVESAQLDGVNILQEFWFITLPMIFPTIRSFLIIGISGIFTNQLSLHTFFGGDAGTLSTIGYTVYMQSLTSALIAPNNYTLNYSQLSAMGIIFSVVLYAVITALKKLLDKYGPSVD